MNRLEVAHLSIHRGLVAHQKPGIVRVLLQGMATERLAGLESFVATGDFADQHL